MSKEAKMANMAANPPLTKNIMILPRKFGACQPNGLTSIEIAAQSTTIAVTILTPRLRPANAKPAATQQERARGIAKSDGLDGSPLMIPRQAGPARISRSPEMFSFIVLSSFRKVCG
jgi:hypothetical protein